MWDVNHGPECHCPNCRGVRKEREKAWNAMERKAEAYDKLRAELVAHMVQCEAFCEPCHCSSIEALLEMFPESP